MHARSPEQPRPVAAWRFVPRDRRAGAFAEEATFRTALVIALRTGHGLGVRVGAALSSGPEPALRLFAADGPSARWMTRTVAPAYGSHRWVAVDPGWWTPRREGEIELRGTRVHAWPEPIATTDLPQAGIDSAALALRSIGPGVEMTWAWSPLRPPRPRWWHSPPPDPAPPRLPPRPRAREAAAAPSLPSPGPFDRPLFGRLDISLRLARLEPGRPPRARAVAALEAALRSPRGNGLVFSNVRGGLSRVGAPRVLMTVEEWAALWPTRACPAGGGEPRPTGGGSTLPLGRSESGTLIGPVLEPDQGRHLAVLGETGMGKSSLLVAIGRRVFPAAGGVVFDPLGETAASLRAALPEATRAHLVWISPTGASPAVNALEGIGPDEEATRSERRLSDLVHALRRVRSGRYEESAYWGPRLEEMVTRALRAAAAFPRGTLVDAHTLLATSGRLGRPVPPAAVEPVRELADRIRDRPEDADGARRLLHEVVRSSVLRRMLCEPEPLLRARDLVAPGRLVVVSGEAAAVGEAASRYLLSIYLALTWSELLARPGTPKTFVVLDEAQWFSHESLAEMLRLGRRRNVHVVLATQAIASLAPAVAEAVWTNVSDFVTFRGSPEEAREFARASGSVSAEEVLSLPRGRAVVLLGKGHEVRWIRTARLPSPPPATSRDDDATLATPGGDPGTPGPEASGGPIRKVGPAPGAPASPESIPRPDPVDLVFRELLRRFEERGDGTPLRVSLAEVRAACDPAGEGVRRAGTELGRRGLCERCEGPKGAPEWQLDERALLFLRTTLEKPARAN